MTQIFEACKLPEIMALLEAATTILDEVTGKSIKGPYPVPRKLIIGLAVAVKDIVDAANPKGTT